MMFRFIIAVWLFACTLNLGAQQNPDALNPLFNAIQQRLALMKQVALYKWQQQRDIEDLNREAKILEKTTQKATALGLQPDSAGIFFQAQMDAAKDIQHNWHQQWQRQAQQQNSISLPKAADLVTEIRPQLGRLGDEIMQLLATHSNHIKQLSSGQVCAALLPKLNIENLSMAAKQKICQSLSQLTTLATNRFDAILQTKVIKIATTGDYPPFTHLQDDGSYQGIDIDMATSLAASLDVEIQWVKTSWPTLLNDLKNQRFDIAMGGISLKLSRAQHGSFSVPYHQGGKTPIALCSQQQRFNNLAGIDKTGVNVIVNPGGTNQNFVHNNINQAQVLVHADNTTIFDQILNGYADVMFTDAIEVQLQSQKHPTLCPTMPGETLTFSEKAYLMPRNHYLKQYVDIWLSQKQKDKSLTRIFNKHL